LFSNWRHLLQQGLVLVICAIGCRSTCDYIHQSLGELQLHKFQYLIGDRLRQVLHACCQTLGSFLQAVHQWSNLGSARVSHQQPSNWECGFFQLLQLAAQPLAVFVELSAGIYNSSRDHDPRLHEAPCDECTHEPASYTHTQVPLGHRSAGTRCSSSRSPMPSTYLLVSQALQTT
jgi:hypothetical protein